MPHLKTFLILILRDFCWVMKTFFKLYNDKWNAYKEIFKKELNKIIWKKKFYRYKFYLRPNEFLMLKEVILGKEHFPIKSFLPKNGYILIDVGAGIGDYALISSLLVGKKGLVIAIEGDEKTFDLLSKNIRSNNLRNVKIFKIFVDSKNRLDKLIEKLKIKRIDLIKIDIEGYEYDALLGLKSTLKKYKPKIAVEIHSFDLKEKIENFLKKLGYKLEYEKMEFFVINQFYKI